MSAITNHPLFYPQSHTSDPSSAAATKTDNPASTSVTDNPATSGASVDVSERALNIQKLNEEFFSGGTKGFSITPDFIDRLQEYGLISPSEASSLAPASRTGESSNETEALDALTTKVSGLIDRLIESDGNNALIEPLQNALTALDAFDQPFSGTTAENLKTVREALQERRSTDVMQTLSEPDAQTVNQLTSALSIAQRLTSGTADAGAVSQYLANMDGSQP